MNSIFYREMKEFLALREKTLSTKTVTMDRCALLSFDQHLVKRGKSKISITEDDVASWIQPMYGNLARNTIAGKVRVLRMFLMYLQSKDVPVYIPQYIKIPETYIPYLFSDAEIHKIFAAADSIPHRKNSKHAIAFPMMLRLLYSCGFRLGELLTIQISDINFERGFVLLRDTKNKKQRIVPLGNTLSEMLYKYCLAMNLMGHTENYIFPGKDGAKPISQRTIQEWFETLLKDTGIFSRTEKNVRGPCLHCFRHLFAVKSFTQAEQAGRSTKDSIPYLSVYLGHNSLVETEKYLKFSNDMFPEYATMFETFSETIFPEVGHEK